MSGARSKFDFDFDLSQSASMSIALVVQLSMFVSKFSFNGVSLFDADATTAVAGTVVVAEEN